MALSKRSETAERVAVRRAQHQLLDQPPVFVDPLAVAIVGPEAMMAGQQETVQYPALALLQPYLRANMAVRSRVCEDALAQAISQGVVQYVILGAGLDTFAYRHDYPQLQVFEVDHPETQAWKRQKLAAANIPVPLSVTYVPVDFTRQTLTVELKAAGCELHQPVFFSWLGVTPYLTKAAIFANLQLLATCPPGSGLVFDYLVPPESLSLMARKAFDGMSKMVAMMGEPWITWFDPHTLVTDLQNMGFRQVASLAPDQLNATYFSDRTDGLRVGSMSEIICAWN